MKLPEPVAWMLNGEPYVAQQCRLFSKNPGEVIPGQEPLYSEAQVKELLAQADSMLIVHMNGADQMRKRYEPVLKMALEALEIWANANNYTDRIKACNPGDEAIVAIKKVLE